MIYEITIRMCARASSPFNFLNHLTDFHEIWHKSYATEDHINHMLFNFLKSITITTWRTHKLVRCEQH